MDARGAAATPRPRREAHRKRSSDPTRSVVKPIKAEVAFAPHATRAPPLRHRPASSGGVIWLCAVGR